MKNNKKIWTEEEKQILVEQYGSVNIITLMQKLNRSKHSIVIMASRMGLGNKRDYEALRIKEIAEMFGVDKTTVRNTWIKNNGLKARRVMNELLVYPDDLLKWMKNNQNCYSTKKLEQNILGKEDKWLKEKRKKDRNAKPRDKKKWSNEEKERLLIYYRRGLKYSEISERLNRSEDACRCRVSNLFK
jgi:excisionase family DNA binding protein